MPSTRAIRTKIKAVGNIRKITKAMELVSASKMKRAVKSALQTREYSGEALALLAHLAREQDADHPFLHPGKGEGTIVVLMASNKGLCGGFNATIMRAFAKYVRERGDETIRCVTVGRYAERAARKQKKEVIASFTDISDYPGMEDIGGIGKILFDEFSGGGCRRVVVFTTHFISALVSRPAARELLPVHPEIIKNIIEEKESAQKTEREKELAMYLFEPTNREVQATIIPRLVESVIYQMLLESLASEHSARMVTMKNASDNAKNIVEDLTLAYNRIRQDSVTREISEIAAGAGALQ